MLSSGKGGTQHQTFYSALSVNELKNLYRTVN